MFELLDWSSELTQATYGDLINSPDEAIAGKRLEQWLLTTGLLAYDDASPRPAWNTFLEAIVSAG